MSSSNPAFSIAPLFFPFLSDTDIHPSVSQLVQNMEDYIFKTLTTSFAFLALYIMIKLVHDIWWTPKSILKSLRQQGIRGTSYRLFVGDMPEMKKSTMEALSKPIPLNNHQIVPRVIPFFHNIIQQHGKVSVCWFGRHPRLIIGDVELIRFILANKNGHFIKTPQNPLVQLLASGVSGLEGEEWMKRRRQITPAFLLEKLKAMVPAFSSSCCSLMERWQKLVEAKGSYELDVALEFNVLAGDVIARTAFGSSYQEGKKIFELQREQAMLVHQAYNNIYIPGSRFIPTGKNKRRYQIENQIKTILQDMIKKKEQTMKKGELEGHDLLSLLLQCKEQSGNSLTIDDVIDECKLFYFAGQETTANLLTWTMIALSMHPKWQEKARQEVVEICGRSRAPDFDAINRFKIVSMVLHEVLRQYPSLPVMSRYTRCKTKVGSFSIPAGVELYLQVMLVHYDTNYWGDNPEEFNPERFHEGVSKASKDQIAFYPFGWGPRICLGQNFAFIEAKMALAMILQNFWFQLSPSYAHAPCIRLTLKPQHGASIILHPI